MKKFHAILLISLLLFTSCIGLSIDIQMNRDGSGKLTMEYRISHAIDSLGALDGNKDMPAIPISRIDWDRTIQRIPGARLASFSSVKKGNDTITTVAVQFNNTDTLLALLSPESTGAPIIAEKKQNIITLILNDSSLDSNDKNKNAAQYDKELLELAGTMFEGYNFSISFSAPGNSALTFTDGSGNEVQKPSSVEAVTNGRRVSMSIGIMDLVEKREGLGVRFNW